MEYKQEMRINEDGRVTVPAFFRRALGIQLNDEVTLHLEHDQIVIRPIKTGCAICGDPVNRSTLSRMLGICPACFRSELRITDRGGEVSSATLSDDERNALLNHSTN